jgi:anti-sigma B factor antagonist
MFPLRSLGLSASFASGSPQTVPGVGVDNDRHMGGFSVRIVTARDQAFVRPAGELDLATVGEFEAAIGGALDGHKQLVVDLRDVTFLDTEGLKSLIETARMAAERQVAFRLVRGRRSVERIFELTETRSRFEFVDGPSGDELDDSINAVGS